MVICLERGADLHVAQMMQLPLTVSCFSKIQIDFTFLVPAYPGSPGQRAVKRVCVCALPCETEEHKNHKATTSRCLISYIDYVNFLFSPFTVSLYLSAIVKLHFVNFCTNKRI